MLVGGALIGGGAALMLVLVAGGILSLVTLARAFGVVLLLFALAFLVWLFSQHFSREERNRIIVIVVLFLAASVFWAGYEQAGSSLNLFAQDFTERVWRGDEFPASWFQSVPAFYVIVLSVVFTVLWTVLGKRQPSSVAKFAMGLIFLGGGYGVMIMAALRVAGGDKVGPGWLLLTYLLHVLGEMCLSPIGLSAVTKLAPARVTSTMMGVWFLASSIGSLFAGLAAGFYETLPLPVLFGVVAGVSVAAGLLLALAVPRIRALSGGVR